MRIFKQKIDVMPKQMISIKAYEGKSIKITKLDVQNDSPAIWYLANSETNITVELYSFMTGEQIPDDIKEADYLGSYSLSNGIVVHVFKKILEE